MPEAYGKELILDLRECNPKYMTRKRIGHFMRFACKCMQVEACDLHFWDDVGVPEDERQTDPKTKGTSAVQFLLASTIVIHTLELRREVYVNAFSCKWFNEQAVIDTAGWCFGGRVVMRHVVHRGLSDVVLGTHPDDLGMLAMGMERVEKLCGWAMDRLGPDGELRNLDPDGSSPLGIDYQSIRDEVAFLELELIKAGLGENGKES